LCGRPGRARELIERLRKGDLAAAGPSFYNSLETPAFQKFPILVLYQEFLRAEGASAALMSGSGSTTFALCSSESAARELEAKLPAKFGKCWTAVVPV
jgi:4-diphosphocytidyl-2-C-methyl-D-erythritol kinase